VNTAAATAARYTHFSASLPPRRVHYMPRRILKDEVKLEGGKRKEEMDSMNLA